jgi:hypothetical protein
VNVLHGDPCDGVVCIVRDDVTVSIGRSWDLVDGCIGGAAVGWLGAHAEPSDGGRESRGGLGRGSY